MVAGMTQTMRRHPNPDSDMTNHPDGEETLMRLAQAGVATHLLRFGDAVIAAATMADEVTALEHLSELAPGPIFRIAPLTYALALGEGADALPEELAARLGGCEPPELTALPAPDPDAQPIGARRDALTIMGALAQPDDLAGAGRAVAIDARFAAAAAEATAERIGALVADFEARLAGAAAQDVARLEAVEAKLDAVGALDARLARIETALEGLAAARPDAAAGGAEMGGAAVGALDARLERIEAALAEARGADGGDSAQRLEAALAAQAADAAERLGRIEAALEQAAAAGPVADGFGLAEAVTEAVARLEAAREAGAAELAALADALRGIEGADGATDAAAEALARVEARLDEMAAARPEGADAVAALALRAAEAAEAARDAGLKDEVAELARELRAQGEKGAGGVDLRRERESLTRLVFSLQTAVSRLDGEVSRLIEAGLGGADADLAEHLVALSDAVAPLAEGLSDIRSAAALGADHAAAVVGMAQAVRDELTGLRATQARVAEALEQGGGADALMEQVSATLAEFLARMERFETQRAAPRPASLLAGRAGRAS
jgi:hypothetical protein